MSTTKSFFFYDFETFGTNPRIDRISQFAGIRTDLDFNIISEPVNIYCKQYDDYLPNPEAIIVTGIVPEYCNTKGIDEAEFAQKIHTEFSQAGTCILGYNNIRFDDEMTRYLFYRNFFDPYAYSWQNGNSRWDLLDVVRATHALRPNEIHWPINSDGRTSLRLEDLTKTNNLLHDKAHDALSDVYATIGIAKLIQEKQPRLFDYFFTHRKTRDIKKLINLEERTPLVHISGMFGHERNNLSIIAPLCMHPLNNNLLIAIDLMGDITGLLNYDAEKIKSLLYTKAIDLPIGESRIPIKNIHLNRAPILAPLNTLKDVNLVGTNINDALATHRLLLANKMIIQEKLLNIFSDRPDFSDLTQNVESRLYEGFFEPQDKAKMELIHSMPPESLVDYPFNFIDERLDPLLFQYRAKNYPYTLKQIEQKKWQQHCQNQVDLLKDKYSSIYQELLEQHANNNDIINLLKQCEDYYL